MKLRGLNEEMRIKHLIELTWYAFNIIITTKHFYSCYKWVLLKTHCCPDTWPTVWKEWTHSNLSKAFEETERMSTVGAVLRPVNHWFSYFLLPWASFLRGTASTLSLAIKGGSTIHPEEPQARVQQVGHWRGSGGCGTGPRKTGLGVKDSRAKISAGLGVKDGRAKISAAAV